MEPAAVAEGGATAGCRLDAVLRLDAGSALPPSEQVRSQLARLITTGQLPVGAKLPTVRRLAADLGMAVNTAARAYRELERAGLVETRGRRGTVVSAAGHASLARLRAAAEEYAARADALGVDRDVALQIAGSALDDLGRRTRLSEEGSDTGI